jgi:hypothetical protein
MRFGYKEPILCEFTKITLDIPRLKLLKLLDKKSYLSQDEISFLRALSWRVEAAENKLAHVQSIIEKVQLKGYQKKD